MNSGWDFSRFIDTPHNSLEQLQCAICLGVIRDAMQLSCGHSFCPECIDGLNGSCPVCRTEISGPASVNYSLRGLIDTLKVCCQFKDHCDYVTTVADMGRHEQQCSKRVLNCEKCHLDCNIGDFASHNCMEALKNALKVQREEKGFYEGKLEEQQAETRCVQNELASKQSQVDKLKQKLGSERIHSRQLEHRLQLLEGCAVGGIGIQQEFGPTERMNGLDGRNDDPFANYVNIVNGNESQNPLDGFEEHQGKALMVHEVKNLGNLREENAHKDVSDIVVVRCLPWRVLVLFCGDQDPPTLGLFLQCRYQSYHDWTCRVTFELRLINQASPFESVSKQLKHTFCSGMHDWGFQSFMPWDEVMDESGGFIKDGSIIVEAKLQVDPPHGAGWDSKKYTGFIGLKNRGPTNCMNSILQTLYSTNALRKAVYQMPTTNEDISTSVPLALQSVFLKLQYNNEPVETDCLTKSLGWDSPDSIPQDTQELLRVLLWKVGEQMEGSCVEGTIQKLFESEIETYIKCDSVDLESKKTETFYDIQLKVKDKRNLYESFDEYIKVEILEGENKYDAGLYGMQEAEKGVVFLKLPAVLHLHLMRFIYDVETDSNVKINDRYEFPSELNLEKYMGKRDGNDPAIYQLQAVLVHSGDLDDGHHVVFVDPSCSGDWYKFDDDVVCRINRSEAMEENFGCDYFDIGSDSPRCASMLVYIRKSQLEKVSSPVEDNDIPNYLRNRLLEKIESPEPDYEPCHFPFRIAPSSPVPPAPLFLPLRPLLIPRPPNSPSEDHVLLHSPSPPPPPPPPPPYYPARAVFLVERPVPFARQPLAHDLSMGPPLPPRIRPRTPTPSDPPIPPATGLPLIRPASAAGNSSTPAAAAIRPRPLAPHRAQQLPVSHRFLPAPSSSAQSQMSPELEEVLKRRRAKTEE